MSGRKSATWFGAVEGAWKPAALMSKGLQAFCAKWHGVCDKDYSAGLDLQASQTTNPSSAGGFAIEVSWAMADLCHTGRLRNFAMTTRQPIYKSLYFQVIVAIVIGILLGHFYPDTGVALKPLGDGFIKLIKMVIAPIIFCTVVSGIAGMQSMKSVGKTGGYALLYFEIVSTIALLIGLIVVNVVQPGAGMHIDVATLDASKVAAYVTAGKDQSIVGFILNVIPNTIVGAFANGDILQVLMFSVIFGFALHRLGAYGKPVLDFNDRFAHVMFNIINMIMKLAPIGARSALAEQNGARTLAGGAAPGVVRHGQRRTA